MENIKDIIKALERIESYVRYHEDAKYLRKAIEVLSEISEGEDKK